MTYFWPTPIVSTKVPALLEYAKVAPIYRIEESSLDTNPILDLSLLDPVIREVMGQFKSSAFIFRFPERSFYYWHVDRTRACALNLELNECQSVTYFGTAVRGEGWARQIAVTPYVPGRYTLLNTRERHCVANTGGERLVLTVGFYETPFEEVKGWIEARK